MKYAVLCTRPDGMKAACTKKTYKEAWGYAQNGKINFPDCDWDVKLIHRVIDRSGHARIVHTVH